MKICSSCGRPFDEDDPDPTNPVEILGDLFLKSFSSVDDSDLCPACKKERGLMGLEK